MRGASAKSWKPVISIAVVLTLLASAAEEAEAKKKSRRKAPGPAGSTAQAVEAETAGVLPPAGPTVAPAPVAGITTPKKKPRRRTRRPPARAATGMAAGLTAATATEPIADCTKDSDCALVADGCCGCHEGGKQRSIPAREKAAYESGRLMHCGDLACTERISNDPTCAQVAVCAASLCELRPPAPHRPSAH